MLVDRSIGTQVKARRLTYLSDEKLSAVFDCVDGVNLNGVPGDFVEFGVALGGSAICLASGLAGPRRLLGFDVFGTIPPPSKRDPAAVHQRYDDIRSGASLGIDGDPYYGYVDNLYGQVLGTFDALGHPVDGERIRMVQGLYAETLKVQESYTIALAHIDCDWYEPVMMCLEFIWPRLSPGGCIILDDYNDWMGCRAAADHFIARHGDELTVVHTAPNCVITPRAAARTHDAGMSAA